MNIRIFTVLLILTMSQTSWAQKNHADHLKSGSYDATKLVGGEVRKIDLAQEKISIRHDEIRGFMPRMTMVYAVKSPKILKDLMVGERIQFLAVEENGKSVVTKIQRDICE
jgi:Cu(I)/Ag(I) efflux system protein CusF